MLAQLNCIFRIEVKSQPLECFLVGLFQTWIWIPIFFLKFCE